MSFTFLSQFECPELPSFVSIEYMSFCLKLFLNICAVLNVIGLVISRVYAKEKMLC